MDNGKTPIVVKHFVCEKCAFKCIKVGDFKRHSMTIKHKRIKNIEEITSTTNNNKTISLQVW
jgi:hypothetical protein